ncbi:hypothetical protein [Hankyongella ginsenosidimutans]|uniref:hypothetical protein n=1 Tax=Hankyongella ginsenosidimutans TaxID=1763828 RepID=UPI001CA33EC4|nr:hypothetical protein [Hankyongella ginsenosidimutans]
MSDDSTQPGDDENISLLERAARKLSANQNKPAARDALRAKVTRSEAVEMPARGTSVRSAKLSRRGEVDLISCAKPALSCRIRRPPRPRKSSASSSASCC